MNCPLDAMESHSENLALGGMVTSFLNFSFNISGCAKTTEGCRQSLLFMQHAKNCVLDSKLRKVAL